MFIEAKEARDRIVYQSLIATSIGEGDTNYCTIQVNQTPENDEEFDEIKHGEIRLVSIKDVFKQYQTGELELVDLMIFPIPDEDRDGVHPNAAIIRPVFVKK